MGTINHIFTSPKADDADATLVRPSDWNSAHAYTMQDAISAGSQVANSGTVVFADSGGVTWGMSGSSQITATVKTAYLGLGTAKSNVTWTANSDGLSFDARGYAGTGTSATSATMTLDSNGLALSIGPYITTARRSTDAIGLNTAKTNVTWTVNSSGLSFDAGGYAGTGTSATNASITMNTNGLAISVAAPGAATNAVGLNTAQTNVTWTVNSSGISFDAGGYAGTTTAATSATLTLNSLGLRVSIGPYITTARASTDAIGLNTAQTNVTWTANSSGLSINAAGYAGTTTAATSATLTLDSGGLRVSIGPYLTTADLSANSSNYAAAWALTSNTAGTTSSAQGTKWYFGGGNSITVSGNSNSIIWSVGNYITTARASTDAIGLNTAKTNVTWTVNSSGLSLDAGGYAGTGTSATNASITMNSAGLAISVAAPGAAAEANWLNLSGNTAGNTTVSGSTLGISGIGAITFSGTQDSVWKVSVPATSSLVGTSGISVSTNDSTISVYPIPMSYFVWPQEPVAGTSSFTLGGSSVYVEPFFIAWPVSASFLRVPISIPAFGSTTTGTTANRSWTMNESATYVAIIYSQNVGASSRSLASIYSGTLSSALNMAYRIGAASNNQTCSHNITYGVTGDSNQNFATNYNVNSGSANISTTHLTAFTGIRYLDIPLATLLTPGNYWLGLQKSSSTASTSAGGNWAALTNCTSNDTFLAMTQISSNVNEMGANTSAGSNGWQGRGQGYWTTNTNGSYSASMQMNHISTAANHPMVQFMLMREA